MTTDTAPIAEAAPAAEPNAIDAAALAGDEPQAEPGAAAEGEAAEAEPAKPEKTAEQREIDRLRRGIDRKTRQLAEERARNSLTRAAPAENNHVPDDDSAPLSLTRAQLAEMVKAEAAKLAPTLRDEALEVQRRQSVVATLEKTWGKERFDEVSSDLDDAFGGLADSRGRPKPATEAVFEADSPAKVIEWLADPDNADEAERISKLSAVQAGKAIAKLESRLTAEPPKAKAKPSQVPAPLESIRGQGAASGAPDPADTKAWIRWRNEQERKGL